MSDVTLISAGPEFAKRWIIKNEYNYYWDGKMWISEMDNALKFHDRNEAENQIFVFLNSPFKALNLFKYKATVDLEVFSLLKPDMDALVCHLWENHTLPFYFDDDGPADSIVLPIVKWDTLREENERR